MDIKFVTKDKASFATYAFLLTDDKKLGKIATNIDSQIGSMISTAIKSDHFAGKRSEKFYSLTAKEKVKEFVLFGLGKESDFSLQTVINLGGELFSVLNSYKQKEVSVLNEQFGKICEDKCAANLAFGIMLKSYRFDKYKTKEQEDKKPTLKKIEIIVSDVKKAEDEFKNLKEIAEGIFLTRNVVSEPPNVIYPETLANTALHLRSLGVEVEVFGEEEMKKLGMNALLGVGQGSHKESKLVVMRYNGGKKGTKPVAFVGKGVTFDTGGISLKPATGMEDMKYDMAGAGTVIGLMRALAGRKAKVNAVGVVGLVENMPGGNAQRPSDVVKSLSGQTIEVLNTDAEGRLVLADALWYCQDRFKPQFMIDLATLTGAITIALGDVYAGLFSNNDDLATKLYDIGLEVDEKLWRMPMGDAYDKMINSDIADVQNINIPSAKGAGSITAAQFLQRFVNNTPWAHLDIAGMAWARKDLDVTPRGATGFGIRLLNKLVEEHYEED